MTEKIRFFTFRSGRALPLPFFPCCARFLCEQIFLLKAVAQCKIQSALPTQDNVRCPFQDQPRNSNRISDVLQAADTSNKMPRPIENARIQFHNSIFIGKSTIADARNFRIVFCNFNGLCDYIESRQVLFG